jgi:hypothetical protein
VRTETLNYERKQILLEGEIKQSVGGAGSKSTTQSGSDGLPSFCFEFLIFGPNRS